ncbi:M42 family metallopeptidase [Candidatus Bathycorpusculum sp.]|uniref:M42 family metallopeptidase n=1 Tax=Candidatus Bathycorpusculum sp. TaxID=2994959 RepID=UPI0028225F40|nr:M42 family metallopeptidase [Candidatus Termitimicrobium sp.]MCL2431252.1 M42 family metallopeptidase [Candidatus Termitimicrobium sp.]
MSLNQNLEKLSNACGVTGRETNVRDLLSEMLKPYADEIQVDRMENVIAIKKGKPNNPKIMLAAHMDEVGLMVKTITKEGFIQFSKMGGIDDRILPAQRVIVHTKSAAYPGVIGSKPPHIQKEDERKKIISYDDLFIDIGAEGKEAALGMGVAIGDPVAFDVQYLQLGKDTVMGKAFDNRAGCAVMVETMRLLKESDCGVCAVGTVQEEVGLRGAATAAFGVDPDLALALDVTIAGDVPGVREFDTSVKMGKGPALTISDSGLITHPKILRWLLDTAQEEKIAIQLESGLLGSTDAARISITRQGIPSGTISIPTRYIHSPAGILNIKDLELSAKLAAAAIQKATKYF